MITVLLIDSDWKLKKFLKNYDGMILKIEPDSDSKIETMSTSLFSDSIFGKFLILAKSVDKWNKDERNWLLKNSKETQHDLVITSSEVEILKTFGSIQDMSGPKQWDTKGWIDEISEVCSDSGIELSEEEKQFVLENVGMNLDRIVNEVEKISIISKKPDMEDVKAIVTSYSIPHLFDFYHLFFERSPSSMELLKKILSDVHPLIVLRGLEKNAILLGQLISIGKVEYSWDDVKGASKDLMIPVPQIADLVGFSLGGKKKSSVLKLWDLNSLNDLIEKLQGAGIAVKNGTDPVFTVMALVRQNFDEGGVTR